MHPALKILIGALMVVVGVYSSVTFLDPLLTMIKGGIGPLLVLVGAFIVWLESDEWKMKREEEDSRNVQQQFVTEPETEREETEEETQEDTETEEGFKCGNCGKAFDTERGLHIHQAQKHE